MRFIYVSKFIIFAAIIMLLSIACRQGETKVPLNSLDGQLQAQIREQNILPLSPPTSKASGAKIELGRLLFFDKILSGNKDISCATCHHPTQHTGDGLPTSIGTGGRGLGPERKLGYDRVLIPRNAPEVFNRGDAAWHTMFWDSRISVTEQGEFISPAGPDLPAGLDNVLAVQAMFPVTSRDEMRGKLGETDENGRQNEIAALEDEDLTGIWQKLTDRLLAIPVYKAYFIAAYPETPLEQIGFQHAANAIGAFEAHAFTFTNSPWNRYLQGDLDALTTEQKQGALLFYGDARCGECHTGSLLSNQQHHNIAVPQVGPGKGDEAPLDFGRARETKSDADKFAFRTPSLHNVALTAPYMHDGAYRDLEAVVRHHLYPTQSLYNYDPAQHLAADLQQTFQGTPELLAEMIAGLDFTVVPKRVCTDQEIDDIVAFLHALTDPTVSQMSLQPESVPSGLAVID